jgi:galactoside O-acetyltransferase
LFFVLSTASILACALAKDKANNFLASFTSYSRCKVSNSLNCERSPLPSSASLIISAGEFGIRFEGYNHVACYTSLIGKNLIQLKEFTHLSSKCAIYSSTDDYSGFALISPLVPDEYRNVISGDVILERQVIVGCNTVILPNVNLGEGAAVGALSLITKDCEEWSMYVGIPAKKIKDREKTLLEKEKQFMSTL